jgi:hypothetical protein
MSSATNRQTAVAQYAPELPIQFPPQQRGKPVPLSQLVEPYVEARYNTDPKWKVLMASVNKTNSPNGSCCFDDKDMADTIRADAVKDHGSPRIANAITAELSRAIKGCLNKRGLGRSKRIAQAKRQLALNFHQAEAAAPAAPVPEPAPTA